jgi:hypothetical protein
VAPLTLPLAAVVAFGYADDRIVRFRAVRAASPRRQAARQARNNHALSLIRTAAAVAGAIVAMTATFAAVAPRPAAGFTPPATGDVARWFEEEVIGAPLIIVDDGLWPELLRQGVPAERTRPLSWSTGDDSVKWRVTAVYVDRTAAMDTGWVPYATFGTDTGRVTILRQIEPPLSATEYKRQEALDRRDRAAFGAELATNPRLTFAPAAA